MYKRRFPLPFRKKEEKSFFGRRLESSAEVSHAWISTPGRPQRRCSCRIACRIRQSRRRYTGLADRTWP
jgi:hypothetical protein